MLHHWALGRALGWALAAGAAMCSPQVARGQVAAAPRPAATLAPIIAPLAPLPAQAPEAVTTEGAEYCAHLQQKIARIEQSRPAAPEAAGLSVEGTRMCGHGNTRAGILRLRRALVLMMHAPGGSAAPTAPDQVPPSGR